MPRDITYTAADYRALPESAPRMELLDGGFEVTPAPSPRHQTIVGNTYRLLSEHSKTHSIGKLFFAPFDVYLGEVDVLQPDIFLLSMANLDRERMDGIYGAPDLSMPCSPEFQALAPCNWIRRRPRRSDGKT